MRQSQVEWEGICGGSVELCWGVSSQVSGGFGNTKYRLLALPTNEWSPRKATKGEAMWKPVEEKSLTTLVSLTVPPTFTSSLTVPPTFASSGGPREIVSFELN